MQDIINLKSLFQNEIVWRNVFAYSVFHTFGILGIFMCDTISQFVYVFLCIYTCALGLSAGVHRLWCHRTYKAKLPLRIFLMLLNCSTFQDNIYVWSRDHRVHHKFSDTDADPYNSKRGFFFCQIGWTMMKKHPDVKEKGKILDLSDVLADPVVKFQIKYYIPLSIVMAMIVPSLIPYFLWGDSVYKCFCLYFCFRHIYILHTTGFVNSIGHMWGYRPYDPRIYPAENLFVMLLVNGEGYHNFHHTFPWDYSSSELGWRFNSTSVFIDFMAWLGLAYDRKKASQELIEKVKNKYKSDHLE